MLVRNCAGAVCFYSGKVFLVKNEREEWVLPQIKIAENKTPTQAATECMKIIADIDGMLITGAGKSAYNFYSQERRMNVQNRVVWYVMRANSDVFTLNKDKYTDGGFFPVEEAIEKATNAQDKNLISFSYNNFMNKAGKDIESIGEFE